MPEPEIKVTYSRPGSTVELSAGRSVSVALSLESPPLDVIQHPALRSSDFPQALASARDHPVYSKAVFTFLQVFSISFQPMDVNTLLLSTSY